MQATMTTRRAIFLSIFLIFSTTLAFSQATKGPEFEVATVKPSALDMVKIAQQMQQTGQVPPIGAHIDKARAQYTFMSLKELISSAYNVKPFQITGPDWLNDLTVRFDITAKMPDGASVDQAPQM